MNDPIDGTYIIGGQSLPDPLFEFNNHGIQMVTLEVTDNNNCSNSTPLTSVTVWENPDIVITTDPFWKCVGQPIDISSDQTILGAGTPPANIVGQKTRCLKL